MTVGPVVFLGVSTLDTIALTDHTPAPDERLVADDIVVAGGGPAATAAVAAARLGIRDVHFVGVVGDDEIGERLVADLVAEGVGVSAVTRRKGAQTGVSVVIVDRGRGTRAICTRPQPPLALEATGPVAELLAAAGWVHVDHLGWPALTSLRHAVSTDAQVSVDCGNTIPGYQPRGVALDVPTEESLLARYGVDELDSALARSLDDGAQLVVATRGGRGSVGRSAAGERAEVPGASLEIVSTLGAGDVFHGALVAAATRSEPLPRALAYANAVAALSCRGLDGRSRIPTHDEAAALAATLEESSPCPTL
ncbi:MAG: carbohydrate kinase family protein [Actinomycetales bacterium]